MIKRTLSVTNILKKLGMTFAVLIIFAAVFSSIFRSLTPWATQYKSEVETHLSTLIGQPVTIRTMETGWYWFQPVLQLKQVTLNPGASDSLHVAKLLIGINLFKSVWHWRIEPGVLYLEDMDLNIKQVNGNWQVDGISTNVAMTRERALKIVTWFAEQERLIVRNVSAQVHFSDGGLIPMRHVNLSIVNHGGDYKIKGDALFDQTNSTTLQLVGDLSFDPSQIKETSGHVYFSAKHLVPAQWQSIVPLTGQRLEGGKGNVALWLDLEKGKVSSAQAQVKFKRLAWSMAGSKRNQLIQSLAANVAWKPDNKGWQFHADHVALRVGNYRWPENQLEIKYNRAQQAYQLFIKSLVLDSLFSGIIEWPDSMQTLVNMKPHGTLTDTQLLIKNKQFNAILTRFDQLGWQAHKKIPAVENITGVLNWQPEEGHLELDSEHSTIGVTGYPTQHLDLLNGALDWKQLSDGLRVSIDRLVVSQPELTLTAEGVVDRVTTSSLGNIRLNTAFSGKNLQQWIALIPDGLLKPKLNLWLKQDIKTIGEATGKITVNGLASDFPFDQNNGEFTITSHLKGAELHITSKWKLATEIEAYLRLKSRNLEVDIVNANFQGAPTKQLNLHLDDIGKHKEILYVVGIIQAPMKKMVDFVMASPLQKKLSTLNMLKIKGKALLNLRVAVPLYTNLDDDILVNGDLNFVDNAVLVHHTIGDINLDDLSGNLRFDEKGITHSSLVANVLGYPLNITMQSTKFPKPYTSILLDGECTVDSLKSRIKSPIFAYLKGMFTFKANFKLTEDPQDLDTLHVVSSLQGLAVNLPPPLGKPFNSKVPLDVTVDFNPQKSIRFKSNYNNRLSTDFTFGSQDGAFAFKSGQVRLGSAAALDQMKPGLGIVGTLVGFDLQAWKKVFMSLHEESTHVHWLDYLRTVHVKLGELAFMQHHFDNLDLNAKILPNKDWSFELAQKNIAATLSYNAPSHSLSGYIKHLQLLPLADSLRAGDHPSSYRPDQIPNLNLRVENLAVGATQIGDVTLKSQSTPERLLIKYLRIDSTVYRVDIQGEWSQKNKKNQTQVQVKMGLKDLAKVLERWEINPAVNAKTGEMTFNGGWNSSLFNFSLGNLSGAMYLQLKSGIITDLSQETEEKLGLGKLLSILSLQTIPRRLQLDFSDLSHQGYSFDEFKGHFDIKKGVMTTQDSYIDGPVAYAGMKGDLDLVSRMYDLDVKVSPHITASLPIVATIAGGPIAGLAAWVANKIISKGMQKITAYSYKVSGPWNQPVVQQLKIVRQVAQAR